MYAGTVAFPERNLQELLTLMGIPATQCCIVWKYMDQLIGKICSMHLVVTEVVAHLYRIHIALTQVGAESAWRFLVFH